MKCPVYLGKPIFLENYNEFFFRFNFVFASIYFVEMLCQLQVVMTWKRRLQDLMILPR